VVVPRTPPRAVRVVAAGFDRSVVVAPRTPPAEVAVDGVAVDGVDVAATPDVVDDRVTTVLLETFVELLLLTELLVLELVFELVCELVLELVCELVLELVLEPVEPELAVPHFEPLFFRAWTSTS
jgi:hypothetical protein